jgi:hypothetical protein
MSDFEQTHEKFLKRLSASQSAVWRVAMWLSQHGHNVQINALHSAPTRSDAPDFADLGDIEIMSRIEVKGLSAEFTCREDWPFPDFLVCNKAAFDKAHRKPAMFYYVNKDGTHIACLDARKTRAKWKTTMRRDKTYDDVGGKPEEEFYVCSPDLPTYRSLDT